MTTNINKIVRTNLTLKVSLPSLHFSPAASALNVFTLIFTFILQPWILSKNTSEIVSTCIEKIYKQVPNSFKNGKTPRNL